MSKKQKLLTLVGGVLLVALAAGALLLWNGFSAKPEEGSKSIVFELVDKEGTSEEFKISTDAEYLADALVEEKLITYASDGYYTTIGGITCDWATDQSWWCITKDGEMTSLGLNDLPIKDGDHYEATYTIG